MCGHGGWSCRSAGEGGSVASEVEHGQGDECVGVVEAEREAGQESDFGVDAFGSAVGQSVPDGGEDGVLVPEDAALQVDELFDAAASGPGDPALELGFCLLDGQLEDQPEPFFEEVG